MGIVISGGMSGWGKSQSENEIEIEFPQLTFFFILIMFLALNKLYGKRRFNEFNGFNMFKRLERRFKSLCWFKGLKV